VFGGPGDDLVAAGFTPEDPGDDALFGGSGDDLAAFAAAGDDRLDGGPGFDRLNGQAGADSCVNGEVLQSCEATAGAAQPLAAARAAIGYGRR
jgi:hypothetical protein